MASLHEECGVFGIFDRTGSCDVVHETCLALFALQHRGQVSCGISVRDSGGDVSCVTGLGLVPDVFTEETLAKLPHTSNPKAALGHVRYAKQGEEDAINSQPLVMSYAKGTVCVANNGCLVNAVTLRRRLEADGAVFQTGSEAEIIVHAVARERLSTRTIEEAVEKAMDELEGAYSFVLASPQKLIAVRDPHGFRPLCIGKLGDSVMVASESCAITSIGGEFVRDVEPGEIVVVGGRDTYSLKKHCGGKSSLCVFEHVYFARSDSVIDGACVHEARLNAGRYLAKEHPVEADVVVGVPDSGIDAAIGYAHESGIPFGMGLIKNRYVGRTFIQTTQAQRERSVHIKLNPLAYEIEGKRVVLVDDSIVRGTTCANIVSLLRLAGAKEVHMRISSPPFIYPCYFGTDISSAESLIACRLSREQICRRIGADSLGYLSLDALHKIAEGSKLSFCDACFTRNDPVPVTDKNPTDKFSRKLLTLD